MNSFEFDLGCELRSSGSIACFDGTHNVLATVTSSGKAVLYSPQQFTSTGLAEKRFLSFQNEVSSFCTGRLPGTNTDVIFVGSSTGVCAFDPELNTYIFSKEVPNGVTALISGAPTSFPDTAIITGGACSLQGFDATGEETFWTVSSDDVTCITLVKTSQSGSLEVLAGSADGYIRLYAGVDVLFEVQESSPVTFLSFLGLSSDNQVSFVYALENGMIGVYNGVSRVWRIKGKHVAKSIICFDFDLDGEIDVVIGWEHGKIEVRKAISGSLVTKESLSQPLVGLVYGDLRQSGVPQLLALGLLGSVKGFSFDTPGVQGGSEGGDIEAKYRDLLTKKQELIKNLTTLEKSILIAKKQGTESIPKNLSLNFELEIDNNCLNLSISNDLVFIHGVVLTSDQAFSNDNNIYFEAPSVPATSIKIPISPPKSTHFELSIELLLSLSPSSANHCVIKQSILFPIFSYLVPLSTEELKSINFDRDHYVALPCVDQIDSIFNFLKQNCGPYLDRSNLNHFEIFKPNNGIFCALKNISDSQNLIIFEHVSTENTLYIRSKSMEVAGLLIQSIGSALQWSDLHTTCHFNSDFSLLSRHVSIIQEASLHRSRMASDSAEGTNNVKMLLVQAEDARIHHQYGPSRIAYNELTSLNRQLLSEYQNRINNHEILTDALRFINGIIQKSASLRLGKYRQVLIESCRKAIRSNNAVSLPKIISGDL
ncbi:hypothetical protein RCL1_008432 [Eukaryota sp. TZLM3-RCL]